MGSMQTPTYRGKRHPPTHRMCVQGDRLLSLTPTDLRSADTSTTVDGRQVRQAELVSHPHRPNQVVGYRSESGP
jgi:hypothetical protein